MAARPAKRPRRSTIIASDDDEPQTKPSTLTLNTNRKPPTANTSRTSSAKTTPQSSPSNSRKNTKQNVDSNPNKSLHSFFGKATEEQRWHKRENTPKAEVEEDLITDDIVDYDSLDDDSAPASQTRINLQNAAPPSKLFANARISEHRSTTPMSSQKFTRPTEIPRTHDSIAVSAEQPLPLEHKPWADRFGPENLDDLAVHKKKVADVQKWLEDVITGKSPQRMLILKGPAGSGKSTTISLIAQALSIRAVSWRNPTVAGTGSESSIQQFADFIDRGGRFESLPFGQTHNGNSLNPQPERQLLIIEDFPTTMTRTSGALDHFRSILLQQVMRSSPKIPFGTQRSTSDQQPIVLIVSESLMTSSTAFSDSFTAHRLFGPELLNHPLVATIEFNPVAPTFIVKAIDLVIKKEAMVSKRRRIPGSAVLQQLTETGDIRSAINSLEFLCARGGDSTDWSGTVAARAKKSSRDRALLTEAEKNALQLISQRESTLDMFHAAGKIVYNKREDPRVHDSRAEPPPKPPDHLMHLYTAKMSQVNVDALLNETGTDIQTFISTLHENYVLSCNGDEFVDSFAGCADFLSDSDYLNPESRSLVRGRGSSRINQTNLQSGNFDMLRQDEISFHVASRGLLFALPFPVNRAVPVGTRKQDAFKIFYPASLRIWKPAEEINDLISLYARPGMNGQPIIGQLNKHESGVASWKSRSLAFQPMMSVEEGSDELDSFSRAFASREDLVVEILPYVMLIRSREEQDVGILKKITQLRGINIPGDDAVEDEGYQESAKLLPTSISLQQRVEEAHGLLQARKLRSAHDPKTKGTNHKRSESLEDDNNKEKMYISDDDIQDD